jgi:hypothetical protein
MAFSKGFLLGDSRGKLWLYFTICPSFLPVFTTVLMAVISATPPNRLEDYIKLSDLIFAGLTLNISNMNVVRSNIDNNKKMYRLFCVNLDDYS